MFELCNNKKGVQWTKEEVELLNLWMSENPSVKLSYTKADPTLAAMFPGRNATALYSKVWNLRNGKTSIPGMRDYKKPKLSSKKHWTVNEIAVINTWVAINPGKRITTTTIDSSLKSALPGRSLEAIAKCYRNLYGNCKDSNDSNQQAVMVSGNPKENHIDHMMQPLSDTDKAEMEKSISFDVVEVINSAIKARLASVFYEHELMKIEIDGLRKENAELIDELERQKKVNRMLSHLT